MIVDLRELLRRSIGEKLQRVIGAFHSDAEGVPSRGALAIWIKFSNVPLFRLFGASDGWHLDTDLLSPETVDIGESGYVSIDDLGHSEPFREAVGHLLDDARIVCSPGPGDVIGVRLSVESAEPILVLNWGDELFIGPKYPCDARPTDLVESAVD